MNLVEMIDITKDFKQGEETIKALKLTNFTAKEGELIAIIGPSGSGKSTFLTIIGGLQTPTSGKVLINGKQFSEVSDKERSKIRFDELGFILQSSNLVPFLTIKDQMHLHDKIKGIKPDLEKCKKLLKDLSIFHLRNKFPNELSGGERQRVAIAKAIYHNPTLILADEPTASLDTQKAFEVVKLLSKETKELKKTTIMVTHDERLIDFCDRVFEIKDGVLKEKTRD